MMLVEVYFGDGLIVLGVFYVGMFVFEDIWVCLNDIGCKFVDIDWYVDQFYFDFLFGMIMVVVNFYCYVIDVNWDLVDVSFYLGQNMIGFCLLIDFDGWLIYCVGEVFSDDEIVVWLNDWYVFYYVILKVELDWVKVRYGIVILYDCYLICFCILYFFEGMLFDFNIGINGGMICVFDIE